MARRPVGREERRLLEAVHEATGAALAAENYAEAYLARGDVVRTISELFQWATAKRDLPRGVEPPV